MLPANQGDPRVTISHQKKKESKNRTLIGLSTQRAKTEIRFLDMTDTCKTLEKNKGVGRKVKEKEPMLEIDKHEPSPIITLLEAVHDA